jgi:uncharacterized protein (DUF433 family)
MSDQLLLECIVVNPKVMVGKPIIRGTRLTVEFILNLLAHGATIDEILDEYQGLTVNDIRACFLFAQKALADTSFVPLMEIGAKTCYGLRSEQFTPISGS